MPLSINSRLTKVVTLEWSPLKMINRDKKKLLVARMTIYIGQTTKYPPFTGGCTTKYPPLLIRGSTPKILSGPPRGVAGSWQWGMRSGFLFPLVSYTIRTN